MNTRIMFEQAISDAQRCDQVYEIRYETPELLDPTSDRALSALRARWFERASFERKAMRGAAPFPLAAERRLQRQD
jgi:hypothetical protein